MSGIFISFEGIDGAGKSTQIALLRGELERRGIAALLTREPGGTRLSEEIRSLLLRTDMEVCPEAELLLYAAARAQIVREVIKPALNAGKIVLCDRFIHSSLAYQGAARGLGEQVVLDVNSIALDGVWPDLTFLFLLDEEEARRRRKGRPDRLEQDEAFMARVHGALRAMRTRDDVVAIDAARPIGEIAKDVWSAVETALFKRGFAG
jgi:dTMP kinase